MSDRVAVFNRGRIEQIGTPEEIYERPATSFVANFIGNNNAIPAVVREFSATSCKVELRGGHRVQAAATRTFATGEAVELSIRPELIEVDGAVAATNTLTCEVRDITYYGDHALVHCICAGDVIVNARIGIHRKRSLERGSQVRLSWQPEDGRAFEIEARK
jgi:putative spermidine/putrescine transport system ATP-binding protein